MDEPVITTTVPATEPSPTPQASPAPAEPTPQSAARAAIVTKYETMYGGVEQTPDPAAVQPEPPAQSDPPAEPAVVAASAPVPQEDPRVVALEAKLAELTGLVQQLAPKPAVDPAKPVDTEDWLRVLRDTGDLAKAEEILFAKFMAKAEPQILARNQELQRLDTEVASFVSDLRVKNPDLVPFEELISVKAKSKLDELQASGKIQSTADFLNAYKASVNAAAEDARKILQQVRAAGKTEAMTTRTTVLSASTVAPTAIDQNRGPAAAAPAPESTSDYLKAREQRHMQLRGL